MKDLEQIDSGRADKLWKYYKVKWNRLIARKEHIKMLLFRLVTRSCIMEKSLLSWKAFVSLKCRRKRTRV